MVNFVSACTRGLNGKFSVALRPQRLQRLLATEGVWVGGGPQQDDYFDFHTAPEL